MKLRINEKCGAQAANISLGKKPELVGKGKVFEVKASDGKELLTRKRHGVPIFEEVTDDKE